MVSDSCPPRLCRCGRPVTGQRTGPNAGNLENFVGVACYEFPNIAQTAVAVRSPRL